jgi:hypothetical protein
VQPVPPFPGGIHRLHFLLHTPRSESESTNLLSTSEAAVTMRMNSCKALAANYQEAESLTPTPVALAGDTVTGAS